MFREKRGTAEWALPAGWNPGSETGNNRIIFCHGGGYFWYKPQDIFYRALASRLAHTTGMAVLSIDYRLGDANGSGKTNSIAFSAPHSYTFVMCGSIAKHYFPASLHDALDATRWIANNGPEGKNLTTAPPTHTHTQHTHHTHA